MARIRTIKPEFWRNEALSNISSEACLLAIGLLNHCDDEGYFNANPKLVESDVFPLRNLSSTTTVLLRELSDIGYINLFSGSDGKTYGHIVNFSKHQVINKKNSSKIKELCELPYDYGSDTVALQVGNGKEQGNGNGKERKKKSKPVFSVSVEKPESVSDRIWEEFVSHRRRKDARITALVMEEITEQAAMAGWSLENALKELIVRNWQTFKADWVKDKNNNSGGSGLSKQGEINQRVTAGLTRGLIGGNNVKLLGR